MDTDPDLDRAINLLRHDQPLPLDLSTRLLGQGVDIGALENKYRYGGDNNTQQEEYL